MKQWLEMVRGYLLNLNELLANYCRKLASLEVRRMALTTPMSTTAPYTPNPRTFMRSIRLYLLFPRTFPSLPPSEMFMVCTSPATSSSTPSFSESTRPTPSSRSAVPRRSHYSLFSTEALVPPRRSSDRELRTVLLRSTWTPTCSKLSLFRYERVYGVFYSPVKRYAYLTGIRDYVLNKKDYLMQQVGNPDGDDKPNKKYFE